MDFYVGLFRRRAGRGQGTKGRSTAEVTHTINQWLRFDHQGTYTIFAETTNVRSDTAHAPNTDNSVHLVSNKVTITITPLAPDDEKKIIDNNLQQISEAYNYHDDPNLSGAANEENAQTQAYSASPAMETLRYLQTPAARDALRSQLYKTPAFTGGRFEIEYAMLGAPDRPKEAQFILEDVQAGRLKIDSNLIGL